MKKVRKISPEKLKELIEGCAIEVAPFVFMNENDIKNNKKSLYGEYLKLLIGFEDPLYRGITASGLLLCGANPMGVISAMQFCELYNPN
jgi:hypothetical protein